MVFIKGKSVLITGSNRGIGRALVDEALSRGAERVYAGTRATFGHPDHRVEPVSLDVTDSRHIQSAVERVRSLDILINNAGVALLDDLSDREVLDRQLAVNFFGPYDLIQAFLPMLTRSSGAIVNNLSINALAPFPAVPSYGISKAAAFSMSQSLRTLLAPRGVSVHAVLTGVVDTDMSQALVVPKPSAASVARGILDGVEEGLEEIFPDPATEPLAEGWRNGAVKALERENAGLAEMLWASVRSGGQSSIRTPGR